MALVERQKAPGVTNMDFIAAIFAQMVVICLRGTLGIDKGF